MNIHSHKKTFGIQKIGAFFFALMFIFQLGMISLAFAATPTNDSVTVSSPSLEADAESGVAQVVVADIQPSSKQQGFGSMLTNITNTVNDFIGALFSSSDNTAVRSDDANYATTTATSDAVPNGITPSSNTTQDIPFTTAINYSTEDSTVEVSGGNATLTQQTIAGYDINNSLLFDGTDDYLSRTPTQEGDRTKWTWSGWVKRGKLGVSYMIFDSTGGDGGSAVNSTLYFGGGDNLAFYDQGVGAGLITNQVFRDPSKWFHVDIVWDTTQATSSDRVKMFIDGDRVTSFSTETYPAQNAVSAMNRTVEHSIGVWNSGNLGKRDYMNGYVSNVHFVDGQALDTTNFGETHPNTGRWVPKSVSLPVNSKVVKTLPSMLSQSGLSGWVVADIVNGDTTTASGFHTDSAAVGSYYQTDFGAGNEKDLVKVDIYGVSTPRAIWDIEYSDNATVWTKAATGIDVSLSVHSSLSWTSAGSHRYWRLYKTNVATGGGYHSEIIWSELDNSGYGTNGFHLNFEDATDLGKDSSQGTVPDATVLVGTYTTNSQNILDGDFGTYASSSAPSNTQYVGIQFDTAQELKALRFWSGSTNQFSSDGAANANDYYLYASNTLPANNVDGTLLQSIAGSTNGQKQITFNGFTSASYKYYWLAQSITPATEYIGHIEWSTTTAIPNHWRVNNISQGGGMLIHSNTTNGSTTFTDSSGQGHVITANGNAQHSTTESKFGGSSMYFDGTGDYVSILDSSDWDFDTEEFTVDTWFKGTVTPASYATIVGRTSGSADGWGDINWVVVLNSNGTVTAQASNNGGTGITLTSSSTINDGTWHHLAFVRSFGNKFNLYIDGVSEANTTSAITILNNANLVRLGWGYNTTNYLTGYIDETRITKGKALWNGNFTVPTAATTSFTAYSKSQVSDTPTNNYATFNPLAAAGHGSVYSNGNLTVSNPGGYDGIASLELKGKTYWEININSITANAPRIGVGEPATYNPHVNNFSSGTYAGGVTNTGETFVNNVIGATYQSYTTSDIIGIAFDPETGKFWYRVNAGAWVNSGDPALGTGPALTVTTGHNYVPVVYNGASTITINFGQNPFAYTAPTGFKALSEQNFPQPVQQKLNEHFETLLYTGNGTSQTITGTNWGSDDSLVWIKSRSASNSNVLIDSVRGANKRLISDSTNSEATFTSSLNAFNSDGFDLGSQVVGVNNSGESMVAWRFRAGQQTTNTTGTISAIVSSNTTSGFSIVKYTGNSTNGATVAHGLGTTPGMVIIKNLSSATTQWSVWHKGLATNQEMNLNSTAAAFVPTYSQYSGPVLDQDFIYLGVNSSGGHAETNYSGDNYIAYVFAESDFIDIGNYTGNASSEGPFVNMSGAPDFFLTRPSSRVSGWFVFDKKRSSYNPADKYLYAGNSLSEYSGQPSKFDFLSTGIKNRGGDNDWMNANGASHIYLAFKEPFGGPNQSQEYVINTIKTVVTNNNTQVDTSAWADVEAAMLTETTNNQNTYYAVSFDGRDIFKIWDDANETWRSIVKNPLIGSWKYNSAVAGSEVWTNCASDDMEDCLSESFVLSQNQMTGTAFAALKDTEWNGSGGWSDAVNTVDFAVGLKTSDLTKTPTVDNIQLQEGNTDHFAGFVNAGAYTTQDAEIAVSQGSTQLLTTTIPNYSINNAIVFDGSTDYLTKSALSSSTTTWTFSTWFQISKLGVSRALLGDSGYGTYNSVIFLNSSDQLQVNIGNGSNANIAHFTTDAVFRDTNSWSHLQVMYDTTEAVGSDRVKLYVNGVLQTGTLATTPSLNAGSGTLETSSVIQLGRYYTTAYWNGYQSNIYFVDGQALSPTSFGEFNPETGKWQPKQYSGTYGTKGFYLDFSNPANLGEDQSGNNNNWTVNGTPEQVANTPTNAYPTMNLLDVGASNHGTFSNGNRTLYIPAENSNSENYGSLSIPTSGKYYFEVKIDASSDAGGAGQPNNYYVGIKDKSSGKHVVMYNANTILYFEDNSGATAAPSLGYFSVGDVVGVLVDMDTGTFSFSKNGVLASETHSFNLADYKNAVPMVTKGSRRTIVTYTTRFSENEWGYAVPVGYTAISTKNFVTPTISNASNYFEVLTYTGNGSTQSIAGTDWGGADQLVWVKSRSYIEENMLFDTLRGPLKNIRSNNTTAELTSANSLTAFNNTGYDLGSFANTNQNGSTYVAWRWRAGDSQVVNNDGTISSTVSANPTSGFSIVKYIGTGVGGDTVGHGLGVKPAMIWVKGLTFTQNWEGYHKDLGADVGIFPNLTNAAITNAGNYWGAEPTNSVIALGTDAQNFNGEEHIAYVWSEIEGFSKFGSYTGNASVDGPFVYTGFKPKYIIAKRTDSTGSWGILDTERGGTNPVQEQVYANLSNAEDTGNNVDFLSNGFKIKNSTTWANISGGNYIFMAFAEQNLNTPSQTQGYTPNTIKTVVTNDTEQIDSSLWEDVDAFAITETTNGQSAYYAVSFDARTTFAIWDTAALAWRNIARNNAGTWEYNSAASAAETWTACASNDQEDCLSESFGQSVNQMTSSEAEAVTDLQWNGLGGWSKSINTIDIAVGLKTTNSSVTPSIDTVQIIKGDAEYDIPFTTPANYSFEDAGIALNADKLQLGQSPVLYPTSGKSAVFNATDGYLSRTPTVAGNTKTFTVSSWVKRSNIGAKANTYTPIVTADLNGAQGNGIYFVSSDVLDIPLVWNGSSWTGRLVTNEVFRDASDWYHIVLKVDTTQVVAADRIKLWINGQQVTSFSSAAYPPQNSDTAFGLTRKMEIGKLVNSANYLDGYLSDVYYVDGQALDPTSFAESFGGNGKWVAKDYTGTYGTNGFHLDFSNQSRLGDDVATHDGDGYATLNTLFPSSVSYSNKNLTASGLSDDHRVVSTITVFDHTSWQIKPTSNANYGGIGLVEKSIPNGTQWTEPDTVWISQDGNVYKDGVSPQIFLPFATSGDTIEILFEGGNLRYKVNGTWANSGNPVATGLTKEYYVAAMRWTAAGSPAWDFDFGQNGYIPSESGYKTLNVNNLPTPSTYNTNEHFEVFTYTGTSAPQTITGTDWGTDDSLVWIKARSTGYNPEMYDSLRGANKRIYSSLTNPQTIETQNLMGFNSNGFNLGSAVSTNENGHTFVAWRFRAGTSAVNNNGTISATVSHNPTLGFSIVKYTGNGVTGATIGHGGSKKPAMMIVKRTDGGSGGWYVYDKSLGATKTLEMQSTAAVQTYAWTWNNTEPDASVFTVANDVNINGLGNTFIAYIFFESDLVKPFSYTGNGSADGPFVNTGGEPLFTLNKRSSGVGDWIVKDKVRAGSNDVDSEYPSVNSSAAETVNTVYRYTYTDTGFKVKSIGNNFGVSGQNYIGFAIVGQQPQITLTGNDFDTVGGVQQSFSNVANTYATLDPLSVYHGVGASALENGNTRLDYNGGGSNYSKARSTLPLFDGVYWETEVGQIWGHSGIMNKDHMPGNIGLGHTTGEIGYRPQSGAVYKDSSGNILGTYSTAATGERMAHAFKNGNYYIGSISGGVITWFNSGNPIAETGAVATGLGSASDWFAAITADGNAPYYTEIIFDESNFSATAPTGFKALSTANLPTPASTDVSQHFETLLYTGNGTSQTITGTNWGSDDSLVWIKSRSASNSNVLIDSVRGANKRLISDSTTNEATFTSSLNAFNSDGFDLGSQVVGVNNSGESMVAWRFRAGTQVANTDGTISSTVSANTTLGFSIVKSVSTGSIATIGHGLGKKPDLIIGKSTSIPNSWVVYHSSLGATKYLVLDNTIAAGTSSTVWNNTEPTSTVFTIGTDPSLNTASADMIFYCFTNSDFIDIGSYTGNGSTDGTFVYTKGTPKFGLFKKSDGVTNWLIMDDKRAGYNPENRALFPDTAGTEDTTNKRMDIVSTGWKGRINANPNDSGNWLHLTIKKPFGGELSFNGYQAGTIKTAVTNNNSQINTALWGKVNSVDVTETSNGQSAYYAVSFDGRTTFTIWDTTALAWRNIVRNNAGTFEYNSAVSGASTWTSCTSNDLEDCLSESFAQSVNQMNGTKLSAITSLQWEAVGGWTTSVDSLNFAVGLKTTNATVTPNVDNIQVQGVAEGFDYVGRYATQMYSFRLHDYQNITSLTPKILAASTAPGGNGVDVKIWNKTSSQWDLIGSNTDGSMGTTQIVTTLSSTTNYVDRGVVRVLITSKATSLGASQNAVLETDYVNLEVAASTTPKTGTEYTITQTLSDTDTWDSVTDGITQAEVFMNQAGTQRGRISWKKDDYLYTKNQVACLGDGGYASQIAAGNGTEFIELRDCTTTGSANTLTITYTVLVNKTYGDIQTNDINAQVTDASAAVSAWDNFDLNFSVVPADPSSVVVSLPNASNPQSALNNGSLIVTWVDESDVTETGFTIERSTDNVTWATAGTVAANVITFTDSGLDPNTQYYYRVKATNTGGGTASSTYQMATVANAPVAPTVILPASTADTDSLVVAALGENSNPNTTQYAIMVDNDGDATGFNSGSVLNPDGTVSSVCVAGSATFGGGCTVDDRVFQTAANWANADVNSFSTNIMGYVKTKAKSLAGFMTAWDSGTSKSTRSDIPDTTLALLAEDANDVVVNRANAQQLDLTVAAGTNPADTEYSVFIDTDNDAEAFNSGYYMNTDGTVGPTVTSSLVAFSDAANYWLKNSTDIQVTGGNVQLKSVDIPISINTKTLQFNGVSDYLNRTPSVNGDGKTFTVATWVKRNSLGTDQAIISAGKNTSWDTMLWFNSSDQLIGHIEVGGAALQLTSNELFRDTNDWYHIVWMVDTTQATPANRSKLFVNGNQITSFAAATYPAQNDVTDFNQMQLHTIGKIATSGPLMFNGGLAEMYVVDGQALDPTYFGETHTGTGKWLPKAYTGTYGTNGFHLDFADAANFGADVSGNANNWTANGFAQAGGLLIHSDTTNGSTTFTDSSGQGHVLTANGNAQHTTAQQKIGASSMYFDGTGDYISVPDSEDFNFGTKDFTIDFWARKNVASTGDYTMAFMQYQGASNGFYVDIDNPSTGTVVFNLYGQGMGLVGTYLAPNVWQHIAVVRFGNKWSLYQDGVQTASVVNANSFDLISAPLMIGSSYNGAWGYVNGYLDELRITKGKALWTSNFTAPTTAATAIEKVSDQQDRNTPINTYATLNALDGRVSTVQQTLANGNKTLKGVDQSNWRAAYLNMPTKSGKWYLEIKLNTAMHSYRVWGLTTTNSVKPSYYPGSHATYPGWGYNNEGSSVWGKYHDGVKTQIGPSSAPAGAVYKMAWDNDAGLVWFGDQSGWFEGNPSAGTGASYSGLPNELWVMLAILETSGNDMTVLVSEDEWEIGAPDSTFKALSTANLPTPASTDVSQHFETLLYTGNGSTQTITGTDWGTDDQLVWIKNRDVAYDNNLYDSIRGTSSRLWSNTTAAESNDTVSFSSFNTNGFTVGSHPQTNGSGEKLVAWRFRAGTQVANTDGTISATVSANTTLGFSIVKYTGNGTAGATIGHGLGKKPGMIIVKDLTDAWSWRVYSKDLGATKYLGLNETNAAITEISIWNNTEPTSSVITLGNAGTVNTNGSNYIAYVFTDSDFINIGSYTGNATADGTFVYTDGKPEFLLQKGDSAGYGWTIFDDKRNPYNPVDKFLYANTSGTAVTQALDFTATGIKFRSSGATETNASLSHLYMTIKKPFGGTLTNSGYAVDTIQTAVTNNNTQIDSTNWTNISGAVVAETLNSQSTYYALSFDARTTFAIWDTTASAWRSIMRNNAGTFEYNSAVSGATTWTACASNDLEDCLSESFAQTANQMTGTQLAAIADANWEAVGGWSTSVNTIDIATGLKTSDMAATPQVDKVSFNKTIDTSAASIWQTKTLWEALDITGLTLNTQTRVQVQSRNRDSVESPFGIPDALYTRSDIPLAARVSTPAYSRIDDSDSSAVTVMQSGLNPRTGGGQYLGIFGTELSPGAVPASGDIGAGETLYQVKIANLTQGIDYYLERIQDGTDGDGNTDPNYVYFKLSAGDPVTNYWYPQADFSNSNVAGADFDNMMPHIYEVYTRAKNGDDVVTAWGPKARSELDRDGDGMPDWYEAENGLNANDAADKNLDADGDDVTNYDEYRNDPQTDPQDFADKGHSPSGLTGTALSNGMIYWTWLKGNVEPTSWDLVDENGVVVASSNTASYLEVGLSPNTAYQRKIRERYSNATFDSALVSVTTPVTSGGGGGGSSYEAQNADIIASITAGTWYNTDQISFTSADLIAGNIQKYQYIWDQSPTITATNLDVCTEGTTWSSGTLTKTLSAGNNYLHALICQNNSPTVAGIVQFGPYNYDATAPIIGLFQLANGNAYTNSTTVNGLLIATDIGGAQVEQMQFKVDAGTASSYEDYLPMKIFTLTEGSHTVSVQVKDSAGNESGWSADQSITVDSSAVTLGAIAAKTSASGSAIAADTWWSDQQIYLEWPTVTVGASGIAGYSVIVKQIDNPANDNSFNPDDVVDTVETNYEYTVPLPDARYVFKAKAKNNAGTWSAVQSFVFKLDATTSVITLTFPVNGASYNATSWAAASDQIAGTSTDATSGLQDIDYTLQIVGGNYYNGTDFSATAQTWNTPAGTPASWNIPMTIPAEGNYELQVRVHDNSQVSTGVYNETVKVVNFSVDTTAPSTPTISPSTEIAVDAGARSGVQATMAGAFSPTITTEANAKVFVKVNGAGSYTQYQANAAGKYVFATPVGVTQLEPTVEFYTQDAAGNTSSTVIAYYKYTASLDAMTPTTAARGSTISLTGKNLKGATNPTVSFTGAAAVTAIDSYTDNGDSTETITVTVPADAQSGGVKVNSTALAGLISNELYLSIMKAPQSITVAPLGNDTMNVGELKVFAAYAKDEDSATVPGIGYIWHFDGVTGSLKGTNLNGTSYSLTLNGTSTATTAISSVISLTATGAGIGTMYVTLDAPYTAIASAPSPAKVITVYDQAASSGSTVACSSDEGSIRIDFTSTGTDAPLGIDTVETTAVYQTIATYTSVTPNVKINNYVNAGTVVSEDVYAGNVNINAVILSKNDTVQGTSGITYYVTSNGDDADSTNWVWEEIIPEQTHVFATPGKGIRWKAVMTGTDIKLHWVTLNMSQTSTVVTKDLPAGEYVYTEANCDSSIYQIGTLEELESGKFSSSIQGNYQIQGSLNDYANPGPIGIYEGETNTDLIEKYLKIQ